MSEDEESPRSVVPSKSGGAAEEDPGEFQYDLFGFQRMMEVEEKRIEAMNRRTDVARQAIEMSDAADQRQFDYHMKQLDTNAESEVRRDTLAGRVLSGVGIITVAVLGIVLYMTFFGNPSQATQAIEILKVLGIGAGGGGVIYLFANSLRWLLRRN